MVSCVFALTATAQDADMDKFVSDLMSRMTLQEKIGQLNLQVAGDITTGQAQDTQVAGLIKSGGMGGVFNLKGVDKIKALQKVAVEQSRLGIPLLVGMDVIHGYETIFPIPFALSCSWDMSAIEEAARIAAKEASADGINWVFSPMVDICVDARWGRVSEGNGEDPYLGSQIAKAMIRGYQGDYSSNANVMACLKHFALYGAVESGLDYNTVDMSRLRMFNQYFPPYKAAVEAGAGSIMSSFNVVDGIPATANKWLLDDVLRNLWKFDGFVATDYGSIGEMITHGVGGDLKRASALALNAGTDMDMCSMGFIGTLEQSVKDGTVSEEAINTACRRVLEAKYKLGLFADPYKYCDTKRRKRDIFTADNRAAARRIAAETFVLLKNQDNLLPLKREGKIALIGPLANTRANMAGTWCVAYTPDKYSTLKEGFERALKGKAELLYAQGCNLMADSLRQRAAEFGKTIERGDDAALKAEALAVAARADVIVCAMGESADMSGECASRSDLRLPDVQRELLAELVKLGKPVVMLNFSGRPTVLTWEQDNVDAILNVWFGGSETADAVCDVLFGDVAPSGRLSMTFPRATGQLPMYYNHMNTGRPVPEGTKDFRKYATNWLDNVNDPLYPFGYGLTYTTFSYGKPVVTGSGRNFKASVTVTNTGSRDAYEVVQLYMRDPVASVVRPVKELKGFSRVMLKAGESKEVVLDITEKELSYYNAEGRQVFEPGKFDIMLGHDSRSLQSVSITAE
ncbi:beta-glucosidase BglX [Prevotella sp. HCN-7019]|uniref:beta-glucosidase BglX n=1 Tax=Prevotella sp. HCN-7019 TaxID=3134668 RepID=UPI0030BCDFB9